MQRRSSRGRAGLSEAEVLAAQRLLANGWGYKTVARHLGTHRHAIQRIARGTHGPSRGRQFVRCPVHGALVKMPCLQCLLEQRLPRPRPRPRP